MIIKNISLLGSGWLGLPLAEHFVSMGMHVKASTTSKSRLQQLRSLRIEPYILDIGRLPEKHQDFLKANVLIINIPSKNIEGFCDLVSIIENSEIKKVLFVSSTSVYKNDNKTLYEADDKDLSPSPLLSIENLFRESTSFKTTIVRFAGLIGYNRNPGRFFDKGRLIGNPDAYVNLIHRDDCIEIISQIVAQKAWGETFNCCADTHPTKREYYTQAAKQIGAPVPAFENSAAKSFKIIRNQKVKRVLNYKFLHPDLLKIPLEKST
ncbi:MAG: hypothetical protein L3J22_08920 [Xanthomonadales bacterium]|nr:hypothetical protein [Xanthomonadales bacterium]